MLIVVAFVAYAVVTSVLVLVLPKRRWLVLLVHALTIGAAVALFRS